MFGNTANHSLVRILRGNSEDRIPAGTGFLVSSRHILTCAHVIAKALKIPPQTPDKPQGTIYLDFPLLRKKPMPEARVIRWYPVSDNPGADDIPDIAVLEISEKTPLPSGASPAKVWGLTKDKFREMKVHVFGFSKKHETGLWLTSEIRGIAGNAGILSDQYAEGHRITPRFGGAPVWDSRKQAVLGMVSTRRTWNDNDESSSVIPASVLIRACPQIETILDGESLKPDSSFGFGRGFRLKAILGICCIAFVFALSAIILSEFLPVDTNLRANFGKIAITVLSASAILTAFVMMLTKFVKDLKIVIGILIPLSIIVSVFSAAYLSDESLINILIIQRSNKDNSQVAMKPTDKAKSEPYSAVRRSERSDTDRPEDNAADRKFGEPETAKPDHPNPPDDKASEQQNHEKDTASDNDLGAKDNRLILLPSHTAGKSGYSLRKTPVTVPMSDAERMLGLDRNWHPLEYVRNDFADNGNSTITDFATGLMWQQGGSNTYIYYYNVPGYIGELNRNKFAGYDDWRLPTVDELKSLLTPEKQSNNLYINPIFDEKQWWCWTSDNRVSGGVWVVNFEIGSVNWNSGIHHVRAVRSIR